MPRVGQVVGVDAQLGVRVGAERVVLGELLGDLPGQVRGQALARRCRPARRAPPRASRAARVSPWPSRACSVSRWVLTETYSPAAIDIAPATSPAMPAVARRCARRWPPATPTTMPAVDTMPSLAPSTPARSQLSRRRSPAPWGSLVVRLDLGGQRLSHWWSPPVVQRLGRPGGPVDVELGQPSLGMRRQHELDGAPTDVDVGVVAACPLPRQRPRRPAGWRWESLGPHSSPRSGHQRGVQPGRSRSWRPISSSVSSRLMPPTLASKSGPVTEAQPHLTPCSPCRPRAQVMLACARCARGIPIARWWGRRQRASWIEAGSHEVRVTAVVALLGDLGRDLVGLDLAGLDLLGVVAGDPMAAGELDLHAARAGRCRTGSSWRHGQRVWNRQPVGGFAGDGRSPVSRIRSRVSSTTGSGTGTADISARVYGCSGCVVQVLGGRLLDQRAEVHHADPVGDVPDHREVVGDDQVGQAELVLQVLQQVDHLGLHRDVQRGHRLVGDDQVRVDRQRPGDADALPLAAGELVRVLAQRRCSAARPPRAVRAAAGWSPPCRPCPARAPSSPRPGSTAPTAAGPGCDSGSWNTICIRRWRRAAPRPSARRCPPRRRAPDRRSVRTSRRIARPRVVLPQPDSPTRP